MYDIILAFITAFALSYIAIPSIISVSKKKHLFDEPGERRSHTVNTPSLGGIAIFAGTIFSIIMWTPFKYFGSLQYILCSFIIIFLVGAKDDIDPISPRKKLMAQLLAAGILFYKANVRITSLYGVFGIGEIPFLFSLFLTILTVVVIINAFNLIDGINGLSGSIGVLISVVFGTWFYQIGHLELSVVAFSLAGATIAFLKYNITPAKIFMGDTGSLLLGLVSSILAIQFLELNDQLVDNIYKTKAAPAVVIGIMILPLFDTLRVFILRAIKGNSPFLPDRSHIHHLLIDSGLNHMQATGVLFMVNVLFIFIVVQMQNIGTINLLFVIIAIAVVLSALLQMIVKNKVKRDSK